MPESLIAKLDAARKRRRSLQTASGAAVTLGVLLTLAVISFYHDRLVILTSAGRLSWLIILLSAPLVAIALRIVIPLRRPMPDAEVATEVERRYPVLGERLLTTIELAGAGASPGISMQITGALARETEIVAGPLDFGQAISSEPVRRPASFACIAGILVFAHILFAPQPAAIWLNRILHPFSDIPIFAHTHVWVSPDDTVVPRGADILLGVKVSGRHVDASVLHYKFERGNWTRLELRQPKSTVAGENEEQLFTLLLPDAQQDVTYYANAGDGQSNPHTVRVEDRPTFLSVKLDMTYPAYTGRKSETITAVSGNVVAPVGTNVAVTATANKPIATAGFVENGKAGADWRVNGDKIEGSIRVSKDMTYGLRLKDTRGFDAETPPQYTVRAQPDRTPEIQIVKPAGDVDRTPWGSLTLGVSASDDYGIQSMAVAHRVAKRSGSLPLPVKAGLRQVETSGVWSLGKLGLKPGDTVEYEALARDADNVSGPHTGRSSTYRIHILSLTEMKERIDAQQLQEREALKQLVQSQKAAQSQLAEAQKQLAKQEKITQAQGAQRSVAQEAADLAKRMQQTSDQMRDNAIGTKREIDRRNVTQSSLERMSRKEMPAAADTIQRAEQRPAERSANLSDAARQEQDIRQELEKLARDQAPAPDLFQLAEKADKLAQQQQRLADQSDNMAAQTENRPAAEMTAQERAKQNALAKEQAKLREQTKALQQQVDQAAQEAREHARPHSQDLASAAKQLQQAGVPQKQSAAQQSLQQGNPSDASPQQNQAAKDLQNLARNLDQAGQKQNAQDLDVRARRLEAAADKLNDMANRQGEVARQTQMNPDAEQTQKLAQREKELQNQAKDVSSQLKDAPSATQALNNAQQGLQRSEGQLSQGQARQAASPAIQARNELRRAANEAMNAARNMQDQQQAREMQMELEKLAREQRAVQGRTQQLDKSRQNGQIPQSQQLRAQALANSQQQLLEKGRTLTGDMPSQAFRWAMGEASRRMENAGRGLQQQNTGTDTQRNQEHAAQMMERIARALGQQADGAQQQGETGNQQSGAEQGMAEASGELQLAREMEAQIRQETGSLDRRRSRNPGRALSTDQEREAKQFQRSQQENRQVTRSAAQRLRSSPDIANTVRRAAEQMDDVEEMLRQKETGDPTQGKQDQIVRMLDQAIQQSRQAMRQQRQQRMAQQQQQQQGQQPGEPRQPGGNQPAQKTYAPVVKAQNGPGHPFDMRGRGFGALSPRAQQSMREGQQERVPAEYRELVNQYYKALSERSK